MGNRSNSTTFDQRVLLAPAGRTEWSSVDNKEARSIRGERSMRLGVVCDLITDAGCKNECPPVCKFSMKLTFQTQQDMPLCTPMIGYIARGVFHHSDSYVAEGLGSPKSLSG
jgi:hypothetical protein